jgi:hypothetical protein
LSLPTYFPAVRERGRRAPRPLYAPVADVFAIIGWLRPVAKSSAIAPRR